jgi:hypothetical protein
MGLIAVLFVGGLFVAVCAGVALLVVKPWNKSAVRGDMKAKEGANASDINDGSSAGSNLSNGIFPKQEQYYKGDRLTVRGRADSISGDVLWQAELGKPLKGKHNYAIIMRIDGYLDLCSMRDKVEAKVADDIEGRRVEIVGNVNHVVSTSPMQIYLSGCTLKVMR